MNIRRQLRKWQVHKIFLLAITPISRPRAFSWRAQKIRACAMNQTQKKTQRMWEPDKGQESNSHCRFGMRRQYGQIIIGNSFFFGEGGWGVFGGGRAGGWILDEDRKTLFKYDNTPFSEWTVILLVFYLVVDGGNLRLVTHIVFHYLLCYIFSLFLIE